MCSESSNLYVSISNREEHKQSRNNNIGLYGTSLEPKLRNFRRLLHKDEKISIYFYFTTTLRMTTHDSTFSMSVIPFSQENLHSFQSDNF